MSSKPSLSRRFKSYKKRGGALEFKEWKARVTADELDELAAPSESESGHPAHEDYVISDGLANWGVARTDDPINPPRGRSASEWRLGRGPSSYG